MEENKNVEEMCNCGCGHLKTECDCNHEDGCCCDNECNCMNGEECTCGDDCHCGDECNCSETEEGCCHEEEHCCCHDEKMEKKTKKDKNAEKLKQAYLRIEELEDQSLRDKAELINYRKRKDEEVTRMLKYANEDIVKELLPASLIRGSNSTPLKSGLFNISHKPKYSRVFFDRSQFFTTSLGSIGFFCRAISVIQI